MVIYLMFIIFPLIFIMMISQIYQLVLLEEKLVIFLILGYLFKKVYVSLENLNYDNIYSYSDSETGMLISYNKFLNSNFYH